MNTRAYRLAKTGDVLSRAAFLCFAAMAAGFIWWTADNLFRETAPGAAVLYLLGGAAIAAALIALGWLGGKGREWAFCLALLLCALLVRCAWAAAVDPQLLSDFNSVYSAARALAQGVNTMRDSPYFQCWSYQTGYVVWMALLIRLFGDSVLMLKLSNALFSSLSVLLVYLLARRFASRQGAGGAALLYLFYPGAWLLTPVLTNQHLSECLLLAAVYVYTIPAEGWKKKLPLAAGAGALLTLSNVIRPAAVTAVLAVAAAAVLEVLGRGAPVPGRRRQAAAMAVLAVAVYAGLGAGLSGLTRATGLNPGGLENNLPQWKFVLGLNQETDGGYSREDANFVFGDDFGNEDKAGAAEQLLRERTDCPPGELLDLFGRKCGKMWGGFEGTNWVFTGNVTQKMAEQGMDAARIQEALQRWSAGLYLWCFLLAALGGVGAALGPGRHSTAARVLALAALAFFCAQLLVEVQVRYRTLMLACAFPLIAPGLDWIRARWSRRREKTTELKSGT